MGAGDAAAAGHNANSERLTCGSWARADGGHACACGDGAIDARALATIGTLSVCAQTQHILYMECMQARNTHKRKKHKHETHRQTHPSEACMSASTNAPHMHSPHQLRHMNRMSSCSPRRAIAAGPCARSATAASRRCTPRRLWPRRQQPSRVDRGGGCEVIVVPWMHVRARMHMHTCAYTRAHTQAHMRTHARMHVHVCP